MTRETVVLILNHSIPQYTNYLNGYFHW